MTGLELTRGRCLNGITWLAPFVLGSSLALGASADDPEPAAIVTAVSGTAQLEPRPAPHAAWVSSIAFTSAPRCGWTRGRSWLWRSRTGSASSWRAEPR